MKRIARNLLKFWETPVEGFEAFWIAVIEMGLIRFIFFFFVMPFVIFAAVETTARYVHIEFIGKWEQYFYLYANNSLLINSTQYFPLIGNIKFIIFKQL